ncbi:hypothetical protein MVEN_00115100 [Mycena venus]|uniref:Uncharacterized protein n=1 Tax=Mycena venus TaxID=2733690 RepID=A0A8H6Z8F9_9AGAR|nr:hypothetical protein MVEN_00115100 [Mycena venus]
MQSDLNRLSRLTASRSQVFASRSVIVTMKDLASLAKDASAIAVALSQLLSKPSDTPLPKDLAMVTAQAEKIAADLAEVADADQRLRATELDPVPELQYTSHPNPIYVPRLPPPYLLHVFRNVLPPRLPGIIYESMVDRLACAFLGHYLPTSHQFLLQPQHTFRRIATEKSDSLQAEWSTTANDGDGSSQRADLSANRGVVFPERDLQSEDRDTSFLALPKAHEPNLDFLLGIPEASSSPPRRFTIPKPRADGPSTVARTGLDTNDRFVDTSPSGLRKPDISILYQGIPSQSDSKIVQHYPGVESAVLAVEVPVGMGKNFSREVSPEMRFFAFTLRGSGLEVAMYQFAAECTDIEPILLSPVSQDPWTPVYHPRVHREMCCFAREVQTTWQKYGLCWAYEVAA